MRRKQKPREKALPLPIPCFSSSPLPLPHSLLNISILTLDSLASTTIRNKFPFFELPSLWYSAYNSPTWAVTVFTSIAYHFLISYHSSWVLETHRTPCDYFRYSLKSEGNGSGPSPIMEGHTSSSLGIGTTRLPRFLIWNKDDTIYEVLQRGLWDSHSEFSPTHLRAPFARSPYQTIRLIEHKLQLWLGTRLSQHSWWTGKPWWSVSPALTGQCLMGLAAASRASSLVKENGSRRKLSADTRLGQSQLSTGMPAERAGPLKVTALWLRQFSYGSRTERDIPDSLSFVLCQNGLDIDAPA